MSTRPTRHAPPPPPAANALYCHTCGRIITPRKPHPSQKTHSTPQKYCSDRCRRSKPRPATNNTGVSLETLIERTFVRLLSEKKIVECGEVEREVFGWGDEGGGGGSRSSSIEEEEGMKPEAEAEGDDDNEEEDNNNDDEGGGGVPLPPCSSTTTSTTTSTPTTNINVQLLDGRREQEDLTPQQRGIRKAKEREMVRQAGRRGVAFGFEVEGARARRKVDCVRGGRVVESSFAKGEWGVKWRG